MEKRRSTKKERKEIVGCVVRIYANQIENCDELMSSELIRLAELGDTELLGTALLARVRAHRSAVLLGIELDELRAAVNEDAPLANCVKQALW